MLCDPLTGYGSLFAFKRARWAREEGRLAALREAWRADAAALRARAALFERAVDTAGKGVMLADAGPGGKAGGGTVLHVNERWCAITGYARGEVVGRNGFVARCVCPGPRTDAWKVRRQSAGSSFLLRFANSDARSLRSLLPALASSPQLDALDRAVEERRAFKAELRGVRKDGADFWCELAVRPVEDARGVVRQFVATVDDVTEKVAQARVIAEQKQFIGSQARLTADSAMGAARALAEAKAVIASHTAENAVLRDTIGRMREQLQLSELLRRHAEGLPVHADPAGAVNNHLGGYGEEEEEEEEEETDEYFGSLHLTPPSSAATSRASTRSSGSSTTWKSAASTTAVPVVNDRKQQQEEDVSPEVT